MKAAEASLVMFQGCALDRQIILVLHIQCGVIRVVVVSLTATSTFLQDVRYMD
jgi:hypothetical protein